MTFTRLSPQNLADLLELLRVIVTMFLGFGFLLPTPVFPLVRKQVKRLDAGPYLVWSLLGVLFEFDKLLLFVLERVIALFQVEGDSL